MKMTFTCEHYDWNNFTGKRGEPISKNILESTAVELPQILVNFEDFLRGCGFRFDGVLDIVDEDTFYGNKSEEEKTPDVWSSIVDSLNNPPKFRAVDLVGKNS